MRLVLLIHQKLLPLSTQPPSQSQNLTLESTLPLYTVTNLDNETLLLGKSATLKD